ncbi:facilitated trehalose transporter Tret1-like [Macrosteles quadrilineatus]|uniref:facilitated trehalose transporter Tret1-like n=1 Tax=Macrosteles quadrilineatus TaxID=74068 RepID=UPI0023E0D427|nr:facilitated trehalose transporter Tret1-like [Macrosteles quadrilineatus]
MLASGSCYGWINPILSHLMGPDSEIPMTTAEVAWVIPIIELGDLISPLPAGILCDYIGRKPVILSSAPMYILGWFLILYFPSPVMLGVARTIHGIAMGVAYTASPIYLGEIAGNTTRGAITSLFSNSWWMGFLVSYSIGPYLSFQNYTWFSLALNIPVFLLYWQPESPYYYIMANEEEKAYESLKWFRTSTLEELKAEMEEIKKSVEENKRKASFRDVFASGVDRKALILLNALLAVRTLSGLTAFLIFTTEIFNQTPNLTVSSDLITIAFGLVMLGGSLIGSFTSDTLGRRFLLITSCIGCLICQICLGTYYFLLFNSTINVSQLSWMSPILILTYALFCSAGMYVVSSTYTSELFPSNTRGIASSIATINITIFCFISLVVYQPIIDYIGVYANFYTFASVLFVGCIYFYIVAPETKGKSFAQIRLELSM